MKKLLTSRDILLLGLSGALDLFEEIKDPFYIVSKSYENMYGWVPEQYKKHNFMHLLWRSIKTGYIEKVEKNGEVYIRLTSQGNKRIIRDFPLLRLQKKSWDKKWRVAIFDIEEVKRNARDGLREKLKELGFGMIQKSVFISPHDIAQDITEFIKNSGLDEVVYIFVASNLATGNAKWLANKVWRLDNINEKYRGLIERIEREYLIVTHDRGKILNNTGINELVGKELNTHDKHKQDKSELLRDLRSEYLGIIMTDPFLPKELLPDDWLGDEVRKTIKKLPKL